MKIWRIGVLAAVLCLLNVGCRSLPGPEEVTDDGLVRVASRASGGVYRKPDATFFQYKRLIVEPPTIAFVSNWRRAHPEINDAEAKRMQQVASELFREEFARALIGPGKWSFADTPDPDVLIVVPRIVDLDVPAPDVGNEDDGVKTAVPGPVSMEVIGDVRDAATGVLVGRLIMFDGNDRYGIGTLRIANRVTNIHEMRLTFGKWSRLLRETLEVARATRPHRSAPDASGELKSVGQPPEDKTPEDQTK
jgi:hypothetical protein